eukprot:TRINITY_DN23281_c0_g1_i1.p1 TRINITY_DN23281_c0_g1~~TRINITY_DN23281_c0_g1_i1.p1  ORF type:complete len:104 (-),score=14.17 TRINITY_DN23281_c0_g1_i1:29-340(-)
MHLHKVNFEFDTVGRRQGTNLRALAADGQGLSICLPDQNSSYLVVMCIDIVQSPPCLSTEKCADMVSVRVLDNGVHATTTKACSTVASHMHNHSCCSIRQFLS